MDIKEFFRKIFSVKNEGIHKIFCIFGLKIRFLSSHNIIKKCIEDLIFIRYKLQDLEEIKQELEFLKPLKSSLEDIAKSNTTENSDRILNILGLCQAINHRDVYNTQGLLNELLNNQIRLNKHFLNINNNIKLETNYPSAQDSNDNLFPESTMDGAIVKPRFINKIIQLFGKDASLLDIGCGGGGIVFSAIDQGLTAFGIDGSLQNKKLQNGYWQILPNNLLTCDATKPFCFKNNNDYFQFSVISSWECLEHIPEEKIKGFLDNVYNNLCNNGYFIGSISRMPYENKEKGIIYHVTLKDENWWSEKFNEAKLKLLKIEDSPFDFSDFCRGIGMGWQDIHTNYLKNNEDGFLFVAIKNNKE